MSNFVNSNTSRGKDSMFERVPGAISTCDDKTLETASQEWRQYLEPLMSISQRLVPKMRNPKDSHARRELSRSIFSQLIPAYFGLLYADPKHPDLWPFVTPATAYAGGNPDHDYYMSPVDGDGVYKITGYRGTVKRLDLQVGTGTFFSRGEIGKNLLGLTLGNYNFDDLMIGKDGYFEVVISAVRPRDYAGDWWALGDDASYILLRQTSYDWSGEVDGRLAIERLDQPAAKPRPSEEALEENLRQLAVWAESWTTLSMEFVNQIHRDQGINQINYKDLTEYGEMVTQRYAYGGFNLEEDEALYIEVSVPEQCRYWSIHLMDDNGFTLDWVNRHTHLNGFMAYVDADGVFRCVISHADPGMANWLDTMGLRTGTVQVRWEDCNRFPEHKVRKLKLSEVAKLIPEETPLVSLAERENIIRDRRRGAQWRKRW